MIADRRALRVRTPSSRSRIAAARPQRAVAVRAHGGRRDEAAGTVPGTATTARMSLTEITAVASRRRNRGRSHIHRGCVSANSVRDRARRARPRACEIPDRRSGDAIHNRDENRRAGRDRASERDRFKAFRPTLPLRLTEPRRTGIETIFDALVQSAHPAAELR